MNAMKRFFRRLAMLLHRGRYGCELDEEMTFHREQTEKDLIESGMRAEDAHYAAMRRFGNTTRLRERSHEVVVFRMESVVQDLRFALRQLGRNKGFAATAILILALGMGASVAIFAFVDAALLQPLPYKNPSRLMAVDESSAVFPRSNLSRYDYDDWKRMNHSFEELAVYTGTGFLLKTASGAVPVPVARVSDNFFKTLGVKPILGRDFLPGEDQPGKGKVVILPYGTWMTRYGGRRDVIGRQIELNDGVYTIVGVLPRSFTFAPRGNALLWLPLGDRNGCETRRGCHDLDGIGRLRPGVTPTEALAELKTIAATLEKEYPSSNRGQSASVIQLTELIVGQVRPILLTLLAGAGLLLLIACVNVACLLLVRSESRHREIAVRGALGATPMRLMLQFVTEGLLLATVGCGAGLLVSAGMMTLMLRLVPAQMAAYVPFLERAGLNGHAGWFAVGVALLAALLLSALPALRLARQDLHEGLVDGGRTMAGRLWRKVGANLVVVELAVAVILLAGAGLLAKSFYKLLHVEDGFDPTHLATVQVMVPPNLYAKDGEMDGLVHEIVRRMSALPGVESVGLTSDLPVQCNCDTDWIRIAGKPYHGEHNEVDERDVSPGYLNTLRAKLMEGRWFTEDDDAKHPQVTVINEALAKRYFPGEDPIGKMIGDDALSPKSMREVVGVLANVREGALDEEMWPAEYMSILYNPDRYFAVVARTRNDANALLPDMVKTVHRINPDMGVFSEISMMDQIDTSQTALLHRFAAWLVSGFAVLALVLSVVGLYGVIAYSVSQRTREIGVRMALGAQRSAVYRLVMSEAGRLIVLGLAVGLAAAVGAAMLMEKLLFHVAAWDAPTLAAVALMLALATLVASYLPARRAARVNPVEALRSE
ncbi:MAG TPA: ABC transporter permease [Acidobacteriaceae bacterium]|nr:ABC transporter permease [Acidobacteriaceae bacterium]